MITNLKYAATCQNNYAQACDSVEVVWCNLTCKTANDTSKNVSQISFHGKTSLYRWIWLQLHQAQKPDNNSSLPTATLHALKDVLHSRMVTQPVMRL